MQGSPSLPFSILFADTLATHGIEWARAHYIKRGMPAWEFTFWVSATANF